MKTFALIGSMIATSMAQQLVTDAAEPKLRAPLDQFTHKTKLGATVHESIFDDIIEKVIELPASKYIFDYERQADHLKYLTEQINAEKDSQSNDYPSAPIWNCENRSNNTDETFKFWPVLAANTTPADPSASWSGMCYEFITLNFTYISASQFELDIELQNPKNFWCAEALYFANTELNHFELFFRHGRHHMTFNIPTVEEQKDVAFGGIKTFMFCEGLKESLESLMVTLEAFIGGLGSDPSKGLFGPSVPEYMEKENVRFFAAAMDYDLVERDIQKVEIDPDTINSGDFFVIMRLDGLDPIVMYGTGSHAAHTTMALRFDGELFVVESQDAWYWPQVNIQRTPWAQWIQWAENADFHVSHLPLNAEARAKFNETAAHEFFDQTVGLPYGYHNFLYGWIDTPRDNLPSLLPDELVPILFALLESHGLKSTTDIFFSAGLNKRLGTEGLDIAGIAAEAADRGMSVQDVMAMVEQDGWIYSGEEPRDGLSYVCSAYVAALYKAAGLFDDFDINATEFTPRDVYTLNVYDLVTPRPEACVTADPDSPFCQLLGKYRMVLPDYGTIAPYEHMAENCPSVAPVYYRPDGC